MRKILLTSALGLCVFVGSAAAALIVPVAPGTGPDGFGGTVTLTDLVPGQVEVMIEIDSGDIRGFFFYTNPNFADITVSDGETDVEFSPCDLEPANNNQSCGGGNNMNGSGAGFFEWGVEIGEPGQGKQPAGDSTFFTLNAAGLTTDAFLGQIVGVRVQSIPPNGDSAKIWGSCAADDDCEGGGPPQEIPEPSTMMMLASGAGLIALSRRVK